MTVAELIELLEDQPQDAEVRLAIQPSWAFEHGVAGVSGPDDFIEHLMHESYEEWLDAGKPEDVDPEDVELPPEAKRVVYIGEGGQIGYLPSYARGAFADEF